MIMGSATVVLDVAPFRERLRRDAPEVLAEDYSKEEIAYCLAHRDGAPHLAVRHAARQALGRAMNVPADFKLLDQVEVIRAESGAPAFRFGEELGAKLAGRGIRRWHLSLSHTRELAVAMVILEGGFPGDEEDAG